MVVSGKECRFRFSYYQESGSISFKCGAKGFVIAPLDAPKCVKGCAAKTDGKVMIPAAKSGASVTGVCGAGMAEKAGTSGAKYECQTSGVFKANAKPPNCVKACKQTTQGNVVIPVTAPGASVFPSSGSAPFSDGLDHRHNLGMNLGKQRNLR